MFTILAFFLPSFLVAVASLGIALYVSADMKGIQHHRRATAFFWVLILVVLVTFGTGVSALYKAVP